MDKCIDACDKKIGAPAEGDGGDGAESGGLSARMPRRSRGGGCMNEPTDRNGAPREALTATIAHKNRRKISEPWKPKNMLERSHKVATFGSCFAQNLGPA